jgi:tRNA(adenine34) deaminase
MCDSFCLRIRPISTGLYDRVVQDHGRFMRLALDEARRGEAAGEVPVGAVIVLDGEVIGRGFNRPIGAVDPTAHAEIVALRDAARALNNYRLIGAVMYVTIEPCLMCVGALVHARIGTLVFGAPEPKAGAVVSTTRTLELPSLNHQVAVVGGVLADECREMVQAFFRGRRREPS